MTRRFSKVAAITAIASAPFSLTACTPCPGGETPPFWEACPVVPTTPTTTSPATTMAPTTTSPATTTTTPPATTTTPPTTTPPIPT